MSAVHEAALTYAACGLSVIPIAADGSKSPLCPWTPYQRAIMGSDDIVRLFRGGCGLAIIGGAVSGGTEILDFDHPGIYPRWLALLQETDPALAQLVGDLPLVETPDGGRHLYYRCSEVEGNTKLATAAEPFEGLHSGKFKTTMIETRGEGGYVLAPPSPAACHETGRTYEHVGGLAVENVPLVTPEERQTLLRVARALTEVTAEAVPERLAPAPAPDGGNGALKPGADWAARTSWRQVLEPYGWVLVREAGGTAYWRRPGKIKGTSATVGGDGDWLYVFSSNAAPLEQGRSYTRFGAWTELGHGGDFKAATRALSAEGYGEQRAPRAEPEDTGEPDTDGGELDPWDDPDCYMGPEADEEIADGPVPDALLTGPELAAELPPLDYLLQELGLVAGGGAPHLIAGYGYSGKTLCCQSLLLGLAAGLPVWGQWRPAQTYRVAHVDLEQGHRLTCSRYQRLARGMGIDLSGLGDDLVACVMPADLRLKRSAVARWRAIMTGRALVVIDSLRAAAGGDENSSEIRSHLDLLGELADETGCRALVIVHARKPSQDSEGGVYAIRGSSAIYDGADSVLLFGAARGEPIEVQHIKARTTGQLAEDLALVVEDVPAEQGAEDQTPGLRVDVRGAEIITEQRRVAAEQRREEQAGRDAERIRAALRANPLGLKATDLRAAAGLSGTRCTSALLAMGLEVDKTPGPQRSVLHRLSGGVS